MEKALAVGDPTPPFHLATDRAAAISPETLKGKPFVLYFYPKDDTSGCTREAVGFSQLSKKFEALGTTVIGVSKDSVASHEKFRSKHKLTIMLASDPDIQAAQALVVVQFEN